MTTDQSLEYVNMEKRLIQVSRYKRMAVIMTYVVRPTLIGVFEDVR
jgi:hypothetical protein